MKPNHCLILVAAAAISSWALGADPATPSVTPDEALSRLKTGNERFAGSKESTGKPVAARRAETAKEQHPFAIIVGCADSRAAPEIIFDQSIGDLFVIRTAGNLVDDYALGSIEYGVEHLGARLIVVLGHERCGGDSGARQCFRSRPYQFIGA
jgi:carbonic anhydrase